MLCTAMLASVLSGCSAKSAQTEATTAAGYCGISAFAYGKEIAANAK